MGSQLTFVSAVHFFFTNDLNGIIT